jgi:YD repeat-containing protein
MLSTLCRNEVTAMKPSKRLASGIALVVLLSMPCERTPAFAAETYQHDAIGRLTDVVYANGGSIHYTYDPNGNLLSIVATLGTTAVDGGDIPLQFALGPVIPNPGSGPRSLKFAIPAGAHVTLRVFDASGRVMATVYDRELARGRYNVQFSTDRWQPGAYFYKFETAGHASSGRFVVVR